MAVGGDERILHEVERGGLVVEEFLGVGEKGRLVAGEDGVQGGFVSGAQRGDGCAGDGVWLAGVGARHAKLRGALLQWNAPERKRFKKLHIMCRSIRSWSQTTSVMETDSLQRPGPFAA